MPSPFPGMNPYFEQTDHWLDFHIVFLSALRRLLAPQVAPKYIVQLEEHIYIHDLPPEPRRRLAYVWGEKVTGAGTRGRTGLVFLGFLDDPPLFFLRVVVTILT
jgi:hypothetical protein